MSVKIEILLIHIKQILQIIEPHQLRKSYTTLSQLKRRLLL
jgi:hypothetical protein